MNTRFIETFVTLAQLRSFRATARELHATPAAISLRVKSLEQELRTELIDRSSKVFRLTASGEHLLSHARTVVSAVHKLQAAAHAKGTVQGVLRLGVNESIVHSWLAHYIEQLDADYADLEVDLTVDVSSVLQRRLLAGELDLVLRVEGIDNDKVISDALAIYPVRWIARKGLFPQHKSGLIKRVLQRPVLTFGRGTAPQRAVEQIIASLAGQADIPAGQVRITCSPSVAAIVQLIKDGFGVAAIPALFVAEGIASGEFVELPIQPIPPSIVISMCRRVDAGIHVHAAATAARIACEQYCRQTDRRLVEAVLD
ncbi:LysR family transcriptional regulator [Pandoraea sp.]|uniref:LysR family transcriptional regulator n=1 Tax=Pandoraea sp. TaxID=1883445 RepID=UPI0011FF4B3C|nr:LysR family transcriptional regulator [Pandoraea sp.]TAL56497.1 MAG: LysR family transcriptional regulator [Pandoraea sp.]TAM15317.1 MAG: LysR family transcriptional regulator [Pandoraea sp.]